MISFKTTIKEDGEFIAAIGQLAKLDLTMDLAACHANGRPLRLADLAAADDFNLAHDVFGIHRHLNRESGALGGCFVPRFAKNGE